MGCIPHFISTAFHDPCHPSPLFSLLCVPYNPFSFRSRLYSTLVFCLRHNDGHKNTFSGFVPAHRATAIRSDLHLT